MLVAARMTQRGPVTAGFLALLVASIVLAAAVGVVGVLRHQSVLAVLAFVAATAVLAVVLASVRSRGPGSTTDRDAAPPLGSVDPDRLAQEIGKIASALGLARAPLLSEIEAANVALDDEFTRRDALDEELARLTTIEAELDDLDGRLSAVLDAIVEANSRIDDFDERVQTAAHACGVASSEPSVMACLALQSALDAAEARSAERHAVEEALVSAKSSLAETIGTGERAEKLKSLLQEGDRPTWDAERERVAAAAEAARAAWAQSRDDLAAAARDLADLETSGEIAALEVETASLTGELHGVLREWLALGVARDLLRETVERYERERQPAVIAKASELFATVTNGRYEKIIAREDERGTGRTVIALSSSGALVDAASLSRGTAEQLYLCLRLGLASIHAERSVALPFVLDDVLVNFDPDRALAVARVIADTAASHQVIVFTCHPHVVEAITSAAPGCRVVEIAASGVDARS
jgi:uncharacterized protein YhaN